MNTTTQEHRLSALALECEAINRYRELEEWFADRGLDELAALCARLATWHRDSYTRLTGTEQRIPIETLQAAAVPWVSSRGRDPRARDFLHRVASAKQLLEMALAGETSEQCAVYLRAAIGKVGPVNWEAAIDSGEGPCVALGVERRLRPENATRSRS